MFTWPVISTRIYAENKFFFNVNNFLEIPILCNNLDGGDGGSFTGQSEGMRPWTVYGKLLWR